MDGFEKEEEEEERANPQTRRQLERMHTVFRNNLLMCTLAFPQFQQFDITKSDLDEWYDWFYGPAIAGRRPPPSEFGRAAEGEDGPAFQYKRTSAEWTQLQCSTPSHDNEPVFPGSQITRVFKSK